MRFLIDAGLPRPSRQMLQGLGHDPIDVRDIGLGAAPDPEIAALARAQARCLLTRDGDFGDIRLYPPDEFAGIVVFEFPEAAKRDFILQVVRAFVAREDILALLPGRLAIVEIDRVRLRPAP